MYANFAQAKLSLAFHYFHVWRCEGRSILLELLSRPELPSYNDYSQRNYVDTIG